MVPELLSFQCPACSRIAQVEKGLRPIGKKFVCKGCSNNFILSQKNQYVEKSSQVELMHFDCSHCNRTATVKKQDNLFGKKLLCKGCNHHFILSKNNLQTPQESIEQINLSPREQRFMEGLKSFLDKPAPSKEKALLEKHGYDFMEIIGQGGMGKVFKVHNWKLKRTEAAKIHQPGTTI